MIIGTAIEELMIDIGFVVIVMWIIGKYLYDRFGGIE